MTKAEYTKELIIKRSASVFNTKGIAGTSMADIMAATDLAKGSLYVHFENKEDLGNCVVDYNLNELIAITTNEIAKYQTAKEKLFAVVHLLGNPNKPPLSGGCPMLNFGMEADDTDPMIREKVSKAINAMLKTFTTIIKTGITKGEFAAWCRPEEFAVKIFALLEGGILMARVAGNNKKARIITDIIKREIEQMSIR